MCGFDKPIVRVVRWVSVVTSTIVVLSTTNCSEGRENTSWYDGPFGATNFGGHSGNAGGDAGTSDAGGAPDQWKGLVINEVSVDGSDYVELFNSSDHSLDISGLKVADFDTTTMSPKLDESVEIPEATTLKVGETITIDANIVDAQPGFQTTCPESNASQCLQGTFGLSSKGETVFLLTPTGEILDSVTIDAGASPEPNSWCRIPDGVGNFSLCASSPGTPNVAAE